MVYLNSIILSLCFFFNTSNKEDSSKLLSESSFIAIVRTYHPVVKQSDLIVDRAKAQLTSSRAGFDPYVGVSNEKKTFDGKNYYDHTDASLKIPTWYGIELKAGLEENIGSLVNPEYTLGQSNYIGISIPLIKNLILDRRRATLQQAKIMQQQSQSEKTLIINDLMNEAYSAYWNWVQSYEVYSLFNEIIELNEQRLQFILNSYLQGDRPAIDTVEAAAQIQTLKLSRQQSLINYVASTLELSSFMWKEDGIPYEINESILPENGWGTDPQLLSVPMLDDIILNALKNHPKLRIMDFKRDMLDIDKKLKFQELLPSFNLNYNILSKGYFQSNFNNTVLFQNNYKYGFDFSVPLRLSKGRGEYQEAKIKIRDIDLQRSQMVLDLSNKIKYYFNEISNLKKQYELAKSSSENFQKLLTAELSRFQLGESSMFLVNSRENKYLEIKQKLIEIHTKLLKSYRSIDWAAGMLR